MTREELIKKASDISDEMFWLTKDDSLKDGAASPMMVILREFFQNTVFTIGTIVEKLQEENGQ